MTADDYVYQIKRLAHPRLHSPIFGLMSEHILGLKEFAEDCKQMAKGVPEDEWLDLTRFPLNGVSVCGSVHLPDQGQGQVPAISLLARDAVLLPIPVEEITNT